MAKKKRLPPNKLAEEKRYAANLRAIQNYTPLRAEYSKEAVTAVEDELDALLEEEAQKLAELDDLRDRIADKGASFVEKNDGSVIQVAAQFGEDSPEYQSLGRKRKSERATGRRRKSGSGAPTT